MLNKFTKEQKFMLWVLALVNFFNYVDRQVIFPLFYNIKMEFHVTDTQLGLLGTVFMLVHSIASVPLGVAADKYARRALVAGGVAFWSVASFASGLVGSFRGLLGVRSLVGIGEASYAPAATAMISDNFPQEARARAQGYFNAGMFVGGTLGAALGGIIAYNMNWRYAFFFVSIPGFALAWLSTKLVDVRKIHEEERISIFQLFRNPAYVWVLISGTLVTFAVGAYISWGVEFVRRYKGYDLEQASIILGLTMMLAGVLGVIVGSYIADKLQEKMRHGRALTVALSLIAAAPLMIAGVSIGNEYPKIFFLLLFFFGTVLLSFYHAPTTAVIHDVVPKHMRATAFAVYLLAVHLFGDTPAPAIIGKVSDQYNLKFGLQLVTGLVLLSGLAFLVVSREVNKESSKIFVE